MSETTSNHSLPVKRVLVLGGGSAGFLAAAALKIKCPELDVVVLRSLKMGVIGVGEGTIPSVVHFLHRYLGIDSTEFHQEVHPAIKLGIQYLWGPRPRFHYTFSAQLSSPHPELPLARGYYCQDNFDYADLNSALMATGKVCLRRPDGHPRFNPNFAYHLENKRFVGYLESLADKLKISKIDDILVGVDQDEHGIIGLRLDSGQTEKADLYVDCSGFQSELLGKALAEPFVSFEDALYCNRAIVGGWARTDEPYYPFTTAETMTSGWCWQIEHDDLVNRGYVYSPDFISDEEAEREFRDKNPKITRTHIVRFKAGVYRRTWVKNVVAIGNAAGFVEPLEATAIGIICDAAFHLCTAIRTANYFVGQMQREIFNRVTYDNWIIVRDFLAIHYRFNSRLQTPFWKACQESVPVGTADEIVNLYRDVGPDLSLLASELKRNFFTAEGYLAMLVGQKVPYRDSDRVPNGQARIWDRFRSRLHQLASNGMDMSEYLEYLRTHGNNFGEGAGGQRQMQRVGAGNKMGELNWH